MSQKAKPPAKDGKPAKASAPQERRASFVVRLTLDEANTLRRGEIEHVASNKKSSFTRLDMALLLGFMEDCVGSLQLEPAKPSQGAASTAPQKASQPAKSAAKSKTKSASKAKPKTEVGALPKPKPLSLSATASKPKPLGQISLQLNNQFDTQMVQLESSQPAMLQVRFSLPKIAPQHQQCTLQVYAKSLETNHSQLVGTHQQMVEQPEQTIELELNDLPLGLSQLMVLVRVSGEQPLLGYQEGPLVEVRGAENQLKMRLLETSSGQVSSLEA